MTHTYLGAEESLVNKWIEAQFAFLDTMADLEAISTGLGDRIFPDVGPKDALYPFIVYQCMNPPRDVMGVGTFRVMTDSLYVVKAVAQCSTYDPLTSVAKVIDVAMTSATGGYVDDGTVFASVRQQGFHMVETVAGTQYRHLGGEYRIQAQG